jgi:hypothetical protein
MFDRKRCEQQGFVFVCDDSSRITSIKLEGNGPKMLLSDTSTADAAILRWRLELKGNNAVEFGTIPVSLQVRGLFFMHGNFRRQTLSTTHVGCNISRTNLRPCISVMTLVGHGLLVFAPPSLLGLCFQSSSP